MAKPASPFSSFTASVAAFFRFGFRKTETGSPARPAPLVSGSVSFDFDNDQKADISRWRPATGEWSIKNSTDGSTTLYNLGSSAVSAVPADYDSDGRTDFAVFNVAAGEWTIHVSADDKDVPVTGFGQAGDKPVVGDYDGDNKADVAVWRPSNRTWYVKESGNDGHVVSTEFGISGDIPVPGNYDGDSKTDIAVYRPSTGDWYVLFSSNGGYTQFHWGLASDIPVPADYDGDGKTDFAVYRGSTGTWYAYKSSGSGQYITQTWGNFGDQPIAADYDGDGKADLAVWRPNTGAWLIFKSCNYAGNCGSNNNYEYAQLGMNGDLPAPASYLKQIGSSVAGYDLAKTRLSPKNVTGAMDLYSRNFNWESPLVLLPGRAGLNTGLEISYNSLIWTKQNSNVYFDADNSNISPGFRFGFPVIEPVYYNTGSRTFNYLMVSPSGARTEFRQVNGASDTYETADSNYTRLKTIGANNPNEPVENISITVTGTDGTAMSFVWQAGAFRCSQIKDKNGNFITINHDELGLLRTIIDTLGRVLTVNYDSDLSPVSITQTWKNNNGQGSEVTHTWATFTYSTAEPPINTNFNSTAITNVFGPSNGTTLKLLKKVTYADGGATRFEYNSYAQVWKVETVAADSASHVLSYVRTNLENPAASQSDCPRFSETRAKVENFNNNQEIVVHNEVLPDQTYNVGGHSGAATLIKVWMENNPYGAVSNTFVGASGWQESLTLATEDWVTENGSPVRKRWSWKNWTQDAPNLSYILNPRTTALEVGDAGGVKKRIIEYYPVSPGSPVAYYGLVRKIQTLDGAAGTLLKEVATEYNLDAAYISRRIIGLPSKTEISGLNQANNQFELVSKVTYSYDGYDFNDPTLEQNISSVIRHDNANYGAGFVVGRGNLTGTTRHDVTGATSAVTSSIKYNTAGAPVAQIDALGRIFKTSYADNFNDGINNRNTYAYPTRLVEAGNPDPNNNFSAVKYRFDTGANVWAKSPKPEGNSNGKETVREFDSIGRLLKETIVNNGAYTRYEYPPNQIQAKVYATLIDGDNDGADADDEVLTEKWTDGAGRVLRTRTLHPHSEGGWSGVLTEYDILGRLKRQSPPTEISVNSATNAWTPAGDDNRGTDSQGNPIWLWTHKKYDWKGRITRIINSDGVDAPALNASDQLFSYEGCGCADGEIITAQSELVPVPGQSYSARRIQKIYSDPLGRTEKTVIMSWDGVTPYATTINTFNGRDQITNIRQQDAGSAARNTIMTFDGHGRLKTRHLPIQDSQTETAWIYNADDSIQQVVDPRGVITSFQYNSRGLPQTISYTVPQSSNIPDTADVTFSYDALGNRTQMTDATGATAYVYNELSQITSETKTITELSASYVINYTYNLSGGVKSLSDPLNASQQANYKHDKIGRITGVDEVAQNTTVQNVSDTRFRAWGGVKEYKHNNYTYPSGIVTAFANFEYDNRRQIRKYKTGGTNSVPTEMEFTRYADGRVKNVDDIIFPTYSRYYEYDHAGKVTKGLSGAEATTAPWTLETPYQTNMSYNAFGEITNINGKHWQRSIRTYSPVIDNQTGRDTYGTGYDAAGNVIQERITNYPTVLNRTLTYDAAGRQVQTYDPRIHSWESDTTVNVTYDGNGLRVKNERSGGTDTDKFFEIRSTVLGGELVSRLRIFNNNPQKRFSVPVNETRLSHDNLLGMALEWTTPERIFDFKIEGTALLDPRGADIGLESPYGGGGDGGGSYPMYNDATNSGRCALDGQPYSCEKLRLVIERFVVMQSMRVSRTWIPRQETRSSYDPNGTEIIGGVGKGYSDGTFEINVDVSLPEDNLSLVNTGWNEVFFSQRLPLVVDKNQRVIDDAVAAVLKILSEDNDCSRFFGMEQYDKEGNLVTPRKDVTQVVKDLGNQLRAGYIDDSSIGIRQRNTKNGGGATVVNSSTGIEYRLFDEAIVNTNGSFFTGSRKFGSYQGNSRAGRALAILHEIAHLIQKNSIQKNGKTKNEFLIPPPTGVNESSSESNQNSELIENICKKELEALANAR